MKGKKERKKIKLPLVPIAVAFIFIIGAGVFLYPTVSNYLAQKNSTRISDEYVIATSQLDDETAAREKQKATLYNKALAGGPVGDPFGEESNVALPANYQDVLNINGTMCTLEIPKIYVKLPVYHGTSSDVLDVAVGHIRQTAVPIGGLGNHTVLTGHTGFSTAKLFNDLVKLHTGDVFMIRVLKDTLYYEVDNISVIEPEELSKLQPVQDKDYVTLVTCTPYGVNSHRLLVRGVRVEKSAEDVAEIMAGAKRTLFEFILEYKEIFIVILLLIILIIAFIVYRLKKAAKSPPPTVSNHQVR